MRRLLAAAIVLVASLALLRAQPPAQPPAQPQRPAGAAPAKPAVPVAASTVTNNPDPYIGEYVSLTAAVEQPLTKTTFSVDQDKTKTAKEVLIIAPTLTGAVEPNSYVTVLGEVVRFDPDEVKKKTKNYTLDLSPDLVAKYKGQPAVIATAVVVNATGIDIAKVAPPPMTAEELELQKIMRQVGPANTALRAAIDKMDAGAVKEQAAILSTSFTKTEAFWKAKNKADATGFAAEAKKQSDVITTALTVNNWDGIKAAAGPLGQQCASCHGAYRERLDDGSFRIKTSSK